MYFCYVYTRDILMKLVTPRTVHGFNSSTSLVRFIVLPLVYIHTPVNILGIEEHNLKLKDLMRFITGSFQLPPLGLPKPIEVKFIHGCADSCRCRSSVSTCKLVLKLPVHISTFATMEEMMKSAMLEGLGFGKL